MIKKNTIPIFWDTLMNTNYFLKTKGTGRVNKKTSFTAGFTMVELIIVIGIIGILITLIVVNLSSFQVKTNISAVTAEVTASLREQQIRAMTGDTDGTTGSLSFGIHFTQNSYTLFRGTAFIPGESSNFVTTLDPPMEFANITFPNGDIVFGRVHGEVTAYSAATDSIAIRNSQTGEQKTVELNTLGVITATN